MYCKYVSNVFEFILTTAEVRRIKQVIVALLGWFNTACADLLLHLLLLPRYLFLIAASVFLSFFAAGEWRWLQLFLDTHLDSLTDWLCFSIQILLLHYKLGVVHLVEGFLRVTRLTAPSDDAASLRVRLLLSSPTLCLTGNLLPKLAVSTLTAIFYINVATSAYLYFFTIWFLSLPIWWAKGWACLLHILIDPLLLLINTHRKSMGGYAETRLFILFIQFLGYIELI